MAIVVFDAQCLLCSAWVQFLLKHDRRRVFRYASMQGTTGAALLAEAGLRADRLETLLLVDGGRTWQHTEAIVRVLHRLGWPWRAAWIALLVPGFVRNPLYRLLARNRYRWFGKSETCLVPDESVRALFLD